jgi:hypothetical protein
MIYPRYSRLALPKLQREKGNRREKREDYISLQLLSRQPSSSFPGMFPLPDLLGSNLVEKMSREIVVLHFLPVQYCKNGTYQKRIVQPRDDLL